MKKILFTISIIFVLMSAYGAYVPPEYDYNIFSLNTIGMGNADLADITGVSNPANLSSREEDAPLLITYLTFMETLKADEISTPLGFFQTPYMSMGAIAYGTNLGLTLNIDSYLDNRVYDDTNNTLNYYGFNKFTIQLDWGYRLSNFDFGMRVKGGSIAERYNFELRDNFFFISDYVVNTFFSQYEHLVGSEFFNLGFSLRLNLFDNFSMAFYSESDVDLSANTNNILNYLSSSSFGFTYLSDKYSRENQINPFVYKISLDLVKIGDAINRELRLGAEMKMQLSNNNSLALRVGYYEQKPTIGDIFSFNLDNGYSTYALVYDSRDFGIGLLVSLPVLSYSDLNNGITVGVSSTFKF